MASAEARTVQADPKEFPTILSARFESAEDVPRTASTWSGGGAGPLCRSGDSALSLGLASTCSDHATWKAQLNQQVSSARALRRQAHLYLRKELLESGAADCELHSPSSSSWRPAARTSWCGSSSSISIAAEDRKKRRQIVEKDISAIVVDRLETSDVAVRRVTAVIADLQRTAGRRAAQQSVTDKRLELRAKRPQSENVLDALQVALQVEQESHVKAVEVLATRVREAQVLVENLKSAHGELNRRRHTMHVDRTEQLQQLHQFLDSIKAMEGTAAEFCSGSGDLIKRLVAEGNTLVVKTTEALKKRVAEMVEHRRTLESEVWETQATIFETERVLSKAVNGLNNGDNSTERHFGQEFEADLEVDGAIGCDDTEQGSTSLTSGLNQARVTKIRERIKSAAYGAGRQLDVLFSRLDRDGSGELDEGEFRRAIRRTLRMPASVISDAEISLVVHALDLDKSGNINIRELIRFFEAECSSVLLRRQRASASALLQQLRGSKLQLEEDLRNKTLAWKLDDSCLKVTPIKGLELDVLPPPGSARGGARASRILATRRRLLPPDKLRRLQAFLNAAAYGGNHPCTELDAFLSRYDSVGSGFLDDQDFQRALRHGLRIAEKVLTDLEAASLFDALKEPQSDGITVADLAAFIGPPPAEDLQGRGAGNGRPAGAPSQELPSLEPGDASSRGQPLRGLLPRPPGTAPGRRPGPGGAAARPPAVSRQARGAAR